MNTDALICPVCEEGALTTATGSLEVSHDNETLTVTDIEYSVCSVCGSEPILPGQIRHNDRVIADAKRRADGLLTSEEIRQTRLALELTQSEAAALFGGGVNAFSKYERGEVIQSVAMDRLMRAALAYPVVLGLLYDQAGISYDYETSMDIEFEYTAESTVHVTASNHPGSRLPGHEDVRLLNDEFDEWQTAA